MVLALLFVSGLEPVRVLKSTLVFLLPSLLVRKSNIIGRAILVLPIFFLDLLILRVLVIKMTLHEDDWIDLVIRVVESIIDFFRGLLP